MWGVTADEALRRYESKDQSNLWHRDQPYPPLADGGSGKRALLIFQALGENEMLESSTKKRQGNITMP